MSSIFNRIINNELPAYKIMEDDYHLAFLDAMPVAEGHTLVIPKKQVDLIFDLEPEEYKALFAFAQVVAKKIAAAIPCKRVGMAVVGLEVPHAHIHLIPLQGLYDMDFAKERLKLSDKEYQNIQQKILNA